MTEKEEQFNQWFDEYADGVKVFEEADMKQAYLQGRADLEQENAELKKENQKWKDEWQEQVQKATGEGYARTLQTIQLTKAKELLKQLVDIEYTINIPKEKIISLRVKAEQFLNNDIKEG